MANEVDQRQIVAICYLDDLPHEFVTGEKRSAADQAGERPMNQPSAENVERAKAINAKVMEYLGPNLEFHHSIALAQALQAVEDAAERRGAVKALKDAASLFESCAKHEDPRSQVNVVDAYESAMEVCRDRANELEAATKAPEGEQGR